jgi:hypothetical protein
MSQRNLEPVRHKQGEKLRPSDLLAYLLVCVAKEMVSCVGGRD